ncbi:hypothetical protein HDV02_002640 [Globomyces sp. JEL0801]|nr:hypothetical protein HDV02_002640 [Globomyces sp. JEL0801]
MGLLFALASAILVKKYARYAAGSGIPEVKTILGGFIIKKFLGLWTLIVKCIGLALSVASGMSLGKEGPLVHVACCVANIVSRISAKYKYNAANRRELMSAACAAGVSVAFGAPIGGVLFSLEEVSYYFPHKTMWKSFVMAMVGALSLKVINPFRTGKLVLFQVDVKRDWHAFELPFFALLGVLGGLYGTLFIKMNVKCVKYRRSSWLLTYPITEAGIIALGTALISYPFQFLRVGSAELVGNLFRECSELDGDFHGLCADSLYFTVIISLIFTAIMKACFTIVTFGIRVPAGVFIPSMSVGACVGRALGTILQLMHHQFPSFWIFSSCKPDVECVTPGTYAIVGAAAALGGVTRMTVSLVVIIFELTGALSYGDLGGEGIYDALIHLNGYPFLAPEATFQNHTTTSDIMTRIEDLVCIQSDLETRNSLLKLLKENQHKGFPVVNTKNQTLGYFGRNDLIQAIKSMDTSQPNHPIQFESNMSHFHDSFDIQDWMDKRPVMLHPKFPLEMTIELFKKMGLRYILVTRNGILEGMVTKKDLLRHSNKL